MGLFKKKDERKVPENSNMGIPVLPELPKLPDFPGMDDEFQNAELPKLPSFPNNSIGNKFSQSTIKEAVAGEKEVDSEDADDFSSENDFDDEERMMQAPLNENYEKTILPNKMKPQRREISENTSYSQMQKRAEPVFIRLDKFEESLKVFENAKKQISEIEHLLSEIKEVKQKEEDELNSWENRIQEIRKQIEKVDQDVFSKI